MNHTQKTLESLQRLEKARKELPLLGSKILTSANSAMYPMDLVVIGIVKRCLSLSSALDMLVKQWNMTCARAILRMQLDTVLRLSAFWLSDDPQKMASEVIGGNPINKMKGRDGKKLSDAYLVDKLGEKHDWVPRVYKYTSGYIHFSERHVFEPITTLDEDSRTVRFEINDKDYKFPEFSRVELVSCATDCLQITEHYLEAYLLAKSEPMNKQNAANDQRVRQD